VSQRNVGEERPIPGVRKVCSSPDALHCAGIEPRDADNRQLPGRAGVSPATAAVVGERSLSAG
jgi:hypothetical protein